MLIFSRRNFIFKKIWKKNLKNLKKIWKILKLPKNIKKHQKTIFPKIFRFFFSDILAHFSCPSALVTTFSKISKKVVKNGVFFSFSFIRFRTGIFNLKTFLCDIIFLQSSKDARNNHVVTDSRLLSDSSTCRFLNHPFRVRTSVWGSLRKCAFGAKTLLVSTWFSVIISTSGTSYSNRLHRQVIQYHK